MEDTENSADGRNMSGGGLVLQNSRLNNPARNFLRPSLFGSQLGSGTAEKPSASSSVNPFLKDVVEEEPEGKEEKSVDNETKKDEKIDPLNLLTKNGLPKSNLFATAKSSIPLVESSGFVFGQNVHERVIAENMHTAPVDATAKADDDNSDASSTSRSNLLFSSVIQNKSSEKSEEQDKLPKESENKSLTEVAREYEESRAQKRKYEEVETFTGEENEVNVVDFNCKLFAFVNANWEERGRGTLRLNDSKDGSECSRVVFRTSGNLRLLLNTKIWPGMVAERPSQKSLRLTAIDNTGQIKIFLIMSRPDDISTIFNALTERIEAQKSKHSTDDVYSAGTADTNTSNGSDKETPPAPNLDDITKEDTELDEPSPKNPTIESN